jgi:hypothetical protein
MAKLSANGLELARLTRTTQTDDGDLQTKLSIRSNGWVLRAVRWVNRPGERPQPLSWSRYIRLKPFDVRSTVTMPQQVRDWLDRRDFEFEQGSMETVQLGWVELVNKVKRG